jgi:hypothetical protein
MDLVETDELAFVRRAVQIMDAENLRPDLEPGGYWRSGPVILTWGVRTVTEPPTVCVNGVTALLNGPAPLPREMSGRLLTWRTAWRNRKSNPDLAKLDFRQVVQITAILGIGEEPEDDEP